MSIRRSKVFLSLIILVFSFSVIFLGVVYPYIHVERTDPGGSLHGLLCTETTDFFQYVSIIRSGLIKGEFLWHNPYAPKTFAPGLVHPTFIVLGHIAKIIHLDQFQMYFWGRLATCILFIISVLGLLFRIIKSQAGRLVGTILFFTITPIWTYAIVESIPAVTDPETYSRSELNALSRLMVVPPHHYLAICAFIILIFCISTKNIRWWNVLMTIVIGLFLPFIHPYVAFYSLGIVIFFFLLQIFLKVHRLVPLMFHILLYCAVCIPMLYVTKQSTKAIFGLTASLLSSGGGVHISVLTYLMAMGLIVIPFIIGMLQFRLWRTNSLLLLVGLWAVLPAIWYYTPLGIFSDSPNRLFQIMPQIAMGIIGAYGMTELAKRYRRIGYFIMIMVSVIFILYAAPVVIFAFNFFGFQNPPVGYSFIEDPPHYSFRIYNIIKPALPVLEREIPDGSVVIAGTHLSSVLSSVTGYYFINGHIGSTPNYTKQGAEVEQFFFGYNTYDEVMAFLNKYHAAGVIFGVDSIEFYRYTNRDFPYYKKIYDSGGVTIVKVELPKQPLQK
jgi:hypothetical protein